MRATGTVRAARQAVRCSSACGTPNGATMNLSEGTFADLIVLHLIGQGHPPSPVGDCVSQAMGPGAIMLAPVACARIRHQWNTPDLGQCKDDGIKLRQQACRTTGTPPRRAPERSSPTPRSEPWSLARPTSPQTSATVRSLDQLVQRRIEVVQFDSHPQSPRPESLLVPFNPRPVAPLQNHALAMGEELPGEIPQLPFETDSKSSSHTSAPSASPNRPYPAGWQGFWVRADERVSTSPRLGAHRSTRVEPGPSDKFVSPGLRSRRKATGRVVAPYDASPGTEASRSRNSATC